MTDFVLQITDWFRLNSRDLPWRKTNDPYFIWLSEVILQQTRVDQGMNYYLSFTETFPTVHDLASASEEQVLKLWQGLGYYSRARNLHATAREVVERFDGRFPDSYNDLLSLKGIGPYTAAAIASFAFDLPHAVVDGNVYRVLSRYFGIDTPIDSTSGKKTFQALADELIPSKEPGLFNQSIMEFGALFCTPAQPDCQQCVLFSTCASGQNGNYKNLPVKSKKTQVRDRYFHYFHLERNGKIAVRRRTQKDVWQHLYEFPLIETTTPEWNPEKGVVKPELIFSTKHILSHQRIYAHFYRVSDKNFTVDLDCEWVSLETFLTLPIHRLLHKYTEEYL